MNDKLTPEQRSWNMSRIRSQNTKPEIIVRSLLHRMGFRFRVNGKHPSGKQPPGKHLPGKPDIVLSKYKTVIFVHGCFWHRHRACKHATMPSNHREYWEQKFQDNMERDKRNEQNLSKAGWKIIVLWECEINADPIGVTKRLAHNLDNRSHRYSLPEKRQVLAAAERKVRYRLDRKK